MSTDFIGKVCDDLNGKLNYIILGCFEFECKLQVDILNDEQMPFFVLTRHLFRFCRNGNNFSICILKLLYCYVPHSGEAKYADHTNKCTLQQFAGTWQFLRRIVLFTFSQISVACDNSSFHDRNSLNSGMRHLKLAVHHRKIIWHW